MAALRSIIGRTIDRRYPGLKPFERSQSALFRGRSEDVRRLTNLIVRERLVVLFAKSGIGKTSLLQAGVAPQLEEQGFMPVFLRSDKTDAPLVEHLRKGLANQPSVGSTYEKHTLTDVPPTLWEQMKRLEFDREGIPATPVLVLDQFEETFTLLHTQASREAYLDQIADLANESTPNAIHNRLMALAAAQSGDTREVQEMMQWWEKQPELRVVISIRSDFLHLLDDISPRIPGILRNRYQLQPLNRVQAQEAIESPARAEGEFLSPQFSYSPDALRIMIDYLAGRETTAEVQAADTTALLKKQDEIESFNLQILCQYVEEEVMERYPFGSPNPEQGANGIQVTPDFYGGKAGLEREIKDFYTKQLQNLPEAHAKRTGLPVENPERWVDTAQRLIEEDLVTQAGRRCSVVDDSLTDKWQVPQEFLDTMVESRLLRKELRLDDFYYEITHDTMLPAILESRERRREREREDEEKARLTKELRVEALRRVDMEKELREVRKQRRMARTVGLLSFGMLLLSIGFGIFFTLNWMKSVRAEFNAANANWYEERFFAASEGYRMLKDDNLKMIYLGSDSVQYYERKILEFKTLFDSTQRSIRTGDSLFFKNEDYAAALTGYRAAEDLLDAYEALNEPVFDKKNNAHLQVNPQRIADRRNTLTLRIESTQRTLITQFVIRQREAEAFKEAGMSAQQCRNLRAMQQLLPTHPLDIEQLRQELALGKQLPAEFVAEEMRDAGCGRFEK
jgi:hypothetical protein